MWKLPDIARRFPLVARPRPACLPLPTRVDGLVNLAEAAAAKKDPALAATVFNQSALLASDIGLPSLARTMCHQHASAYLHASPLTVSAAIRALEPVINLVRLHIRAGRGDDGRNRLLALYEAVTAGRSAHFEGVTVPADLTSTDEERREVRAWLWSVVLADGTRTLTNAGRWADALAHIEQHRGIGRRMLDGRQVAVLATLTSGATPAAQALLKETAPGEPWEQAVTACLTVLCRQTLGQPVNQQLPTLVEEFIQRPAGDGLTVFNTRLGLTILGAVGSPGPAARRIVSGLYRRVLHATDGYAARDCLSDAVFAALATEEQSGTCRKIVRECALDARALSGAHAAALTDALHISDGVIRDSIRGRVCRSRP